MGRRGTDRVAIGSNFALRVTGDALENGEVWWPRTYRIQGTPINGPETWPKGGRTRPFLPFGGHRDGPEMGLIHAFTGDLKDMSVYIGRSGRFPQENRRFRLAATS